MIHARLDTSCQPFRIRFEQCVPTVNPKATAKLEKCSAGCRLHTLRIQYQVGFNPLVLAIELMNANRFCCCEFISETDLLAQIQATKGEPQTSKDVSPRCVPCRCTVSGVRCITLFFTRHVEQPGT